MSVTFEADCASQNPKAAFIMPLHPLVKQAAMSLEATPQAATTLQVRTSEVAAGRYEFAIYQWQFHGIGEDMVLRPVASAEALTPHLDRLLEKAEDAIIDEPGGSEEPMWEQLDARHYELWAEAHEKHRQRMQELVAYRRESLSTSHRARIRLLEDQLEEAHNENIRRMRRSQLATAEADYARRMQELEGVADRADIIAEPVAYGILDIKGEA